MLKANITTIKRFRIVPFLASLIVFELVILLLPGLNLVRFLVLGEYPKNVLNDLIYYLQLMHYFFFFSFGIPIALARALSSYQDRGGYVWRVVVLSTSLAFLVGLSWSLFTLARCGFFSANVVCTDFTMFISVFFLVVNGCLALPVSFLSAMFFLTSGQNKHKT